MSSATLAHTNGSKPALTMDAWQQTSTRKFFSSVNWDDNPPEVQEIKQKIVEDPAAVDLTLDLTVSQFFSLVNWDDNAVAPQPSATPDALLAELLDEPSSGFTLEDFTELF